MGVNIVPFKAKKFMGACECTSERLYEEGINHEHLFVHPDFPESANDLDSGYYTGEHLGAEYYSGYGSYNILRNHIAVAVHGVTAETIWGRLDKYRGSAFFEMINFSDCEGTIGTKAVRKLAKDFEEHKGSITDHLDSIGNRRLSEAFCSLAEVFIEAAGNDGVVVYC